MFPRLEACRSGIKFREFACEFSGLHSGWPNDPGARLPPYRPTAPLNSQPDREQALRFTCGPYKIGQCPNLSHHQDSANSDPHVEGGSQPCPFVEIKAPPERNAKNKRLPICKLRRLTL